MPRSHLSRCLSTLLTAAALTLGLLLPAQEASAATTLSGSVSTARVADGRIGVDVTLRSTRRTKVSHVAVCALDAGGERRDFGSSGRATLTSKKRTWSKSAQLDPGTYTYWACVKRGKNWSAVGRRKTVTVPAVAAEPSGAPSTPAAPNPTPSSPAVPSPTPTASAAPGTSGSAVRVGAMPTTAPAGWRRVFADDFTTDLQAGGFPGAYAGRWMSYDGFPNTSRDGDYDQSIISAKNGILDLDLHAVAGRPKVAAPVPLVGGRWGGQVYGRYSVRMKADPTAGYGVAFLLWSDRNVWEDGEINFPESALDSRANGFNHCPGNPQQNCHWFAAGQGYADWHTYTIEWTPTRLSYLVDDVVVSTTTTNIPNRSLHWVLQVETPNKNEALRTTSHIDLDWATIDALA